MPVDLSVILLIAVGSLMVGSLPLYPYSKRWGFGPSVVLAMFLLVLLVVAFS